MSGDDQGSIDAEFARIAGQLAADTDTDDAAEPLFSWDGDELVVHADISALLRASAVIVVTMLGTNVGMPGRCDDAQDALGVSIMLGTETNGVLATIEQTRWSAETALSWTMVINQARLEILRRDDSTDLTALDPTNADHLLASALTMVLDLLCRAMY